MTHPLLANALYNRGTCHGIPIMYNSKLPRCYTKMAIMAGQLILSVWPTISYLLSQKQHSMIRVVRIPHIGTKRKPLTKAGSPNILVHVVATYDDFQTSLLCRHGLRLPDTRARFDTFAEYNGIVRGYTKNLVIRLTLIINSIIFCHDHL